jgi:thioesterase domain-containing protein
LYVAPRTPLEQWLADLLKTILGLEQIGVEDNFFELGGDSIKGAVFINRLQEALGQYVYVVAIFDAPTIARLAVYLKENYPEAVARLFGEETEPVTESSDERIDAAKVQTLRQAITPLAPAKATDAEEGVKKNPSAIFILSPPRSGSTLLRVMAAGHPQLFAPPELELLSCNTLEERREVFTGRNSFSLEGTLRALMQLKQCDAEEAKSIMREYEDGGMTTRQFYHLMQEWIGERRLVDKTPSYALDLEVLRRAESDFEQAQYVHLVRHPAAMIVSFEEARLDQVFFRYPHNFSRRQLAELIWVISQENILDFLSDVPPERQYRLQFEELLREPRRQMQRLCDFLHIEFTEAMIEPYQDKELRMTDGIHPESKMHGDMKFHEHKGIDPKTAERWREGAERLELGEITWQLAERLGYERPVAQDHEAAENEKSGALEEGGESGQQATASSQASYIVEIQAGDSKQPFFCVHPLGGNVLCYFDLARHMGSDQPFYGLQAVGLNGEESLRDTGVESIAAQYIEALRSVQPEGPYALGGWSMGGVVAFEMAQQLLAQDQKVSKLVLLDAWAPGGKRGPMPNDEQRFLARFAFNLGLSFKQLTVPLDQIGQLEPDEQLTYVMDLAKSSEIIPSNMTLPYFRRLFNVFKTNILAIRSYEPHLYAGSITLFRAGERFNPQQASPSWGQTILRGIKRNGAEQRAGGKDGANGWAALAAEGVDVREVPGDHYTMLRKPHVEVLAEQLKDCLASVQVAELVI